MLKKLQKNKSEGFTIIEVMIVLAIAGLILLIVFLAIPALQRSQHNTQRKNDAASVSAAIANFLSNNGGQVPSTVSGDGTNTNNLVIRRGATGNSETAKLGFYTTATSATAGASSGNVFISTVAAAPTMTNNNGAAASATNVTNNSLAIVVGVGCNDTQTGPGTVNARTAAVFYNTESATGNGALQCVEQ
ncbi:MAG TPA: type II secretion system protein [Candidatus Saccharimonadales bacterium]